MTNKEASKILYEMPISTMSERTFEEIAEAIDFAIKALRQMDSCPVYSDEEVKQPCIESPCSIDADGNIRDFNGRVLFIHPTYNMDEYGDSEVDNEHIQ